MSTFKGGDRVQYKPQKNNPLSGKQGTVTHLPNDLRYKDEVRVRFDDYASTWVPISLLVKIS